MNKKYELLLDDTIEVFGCKLFRIKALISFGSIKKEDLGGYIEKEKNLSHSDNAWVYDNAKVYGNARVYDNARVSDNAKVFGDARVSGNTRVYGNARVYGDTRVSGNTRVYGDAWVFGNAKVFGNARVSGDALVYGNARVYDNAWVYGNARVYGNAWVSGDAAVSGDARVKYPQDYIVFKNTWSSFRWFTYTKSNKMWRVGCFYGTGEELVKKAYEDNEKSGRCYEAYVNLVLELEKIE
ncbi:polymer-forming cytoskeletal protein [Streptococcus equi subsp. zooepidemicus]|uniref:polymer-forming cytoskeletal protein n=1 Tax=Streptococcus equi TaxID=1336 RepID=UPI001BB06C63|nr:polymer-forming cytoskeletal protein [Streptococcus equi]QUF62153.1 polymer-forming cytoskeletal protein [Streptococcus equi subsp. zooepidemicus]HEL0797493.1 polymer-forming cytoskeletal protein [Streptococcus equi subsp. zooepidemicus]